MPAPDPLPNFFDDPSIFGGFAMSVDEMSFVVPGPGWNVDGPFSIGVFGKLNPLPASAWKRDWIPITDEAALEMLTERRARRQARP